jgi:hypothetical protein
MGNGRDGASTQRSQVKLHQSSAPRSRAREAFERRDLERQLRIHEIAASAAIQTVLALNGSDETPHLGSGRRTPYTLRSASRSLKWFHGRHLPVATARKVL